MTWCLPSVSPGLENDESRSPQAVDPEVHLEQAGGGGKRLRIYGEENSHSLQSTQLDCMDCGLHQSVASADPTLLSMSDPSSSLS